MRCQLRNVGLELSDTPEADMTTLNIPISDEISKRLQELAGREGVSSEDLARAGLEDWLTRCRPDFLETARYVIEKNRELYRRLA